MSCKEVVTLFKYSLHKMSETNVATGAAQPMANMEAPGIWLNTKDRGMRMANVEIAL